MALATALSNEQLMKYAPSVFATEASSETSDKYTFIPTSNIVEALRKEGFVPVKAQQSNVRTEDGKMFAKHSLRFRMDSILNGLSVGDEVPELVLVNSHNRSSGFQLSAGMYRLVCSNGMTVKSSNFGDISVRHSGNIIDNVIEGSARIIEEMPKIVDAVHQYKSLILSPEHQQIFAEAALQLRYPFDDEGKSTSPIQSSQLLQVRRTADAGNDLWKTFNRVQENFIRGGMRGVGTTGKRTKLRGHYVSIRRSAC
jgi:hypothetical protein